MPNPNNVAGGHKAAANNPNVSDEAKENSKQAASNIQGGDADVGGDVQDDVADVPVDEDADYDDEAPTGEVKEEKPKNQGNFIGGHKATLSNPGTSEEAKEHSRQVLQEQGVEVDK